MTVREVSARVQIEAEAVAGGWVIQANENWTSFALGEYRIHCDWLGDAAARMVAISFRPRHGGELAAVRGDRAIDHLRFWLRVPELSPVTPRAAGTVVGLALSVLDYAEQLEATEADDVIGARYVAATLREIVAGAQP